ncbi:MAG: TGS domain-containing protein, partial [Bacteroidetes bacterium]|nr:TGS domain-containing protein [Bacteroidota bacterium]
PIEQVLVESGFDCELKSRVKSIPSIHRKMVTQKVDFEKVYDLFAIRVILNKTIENDAADCWKIYSLITDIYTPNPRRLRDWISFPKSTGYESLHTTVIGPEGRWVEVQIRTRRMDEVAEKGLAAHWKYKAGNKAQTRDALFADVRELLENPSQSSLEKSISRDKKALYTDEIFIFTPKGDLKKLKSGYSVLDFAFEIHSEIGSTCTGAIVNGKMVPLKHILENGDMVKIMTSKTQKPNPGWLEIVKSPRNIARIKHALKMEAYKEADFGKEIIKNKVSQLGYEFADPLVNKLAAYFGCDSIMELYQRFGEGKADPLKIKKALLEPDPGIVPVPEKEETFPERISGMMAGKEDFVIIDPKIKSLHYQYARCCSPAPGNSIFAFVSVSQGIKIHKTTCANAHQLITRYPYRVLEARWKEMK